MPREISSQEQLESRFYSEPVIEERSSGITWAAVIAGAFVAAAFYLLLIALGSAFGLAAISPWLNRGAPSLALETGAIVWLIGTEVFSSALGGYLTGRLRTKWTLIHADEVYFRDTANGFLAWAVALVVTVTILASAALSMAGQAERSSPAAESALDPNAYFVDLLYRSDRSAPRDSDASLRAETSRILTTAMRLPDISATDRGYLVKMISSRAEISGQDADRRVTDVLNQMRQSADALRKATEHFLLWMFVALSLGAFAACYAAMLGGRERDHVARA